MNTLQHIAINGLFLRKPGSGIGQVTKYFLEEFQKLDIQGGRYTVYVDEDRVVSLGEQGRVVYIKPWWQRDDLLRRLLWEHIQLPKKALADDVTHFLSLYQAPTEFPKAVSHVMIVHDIIPELFPEYIGNSRTRLLWNLTKRAAKKATRIVAVSQSTKRDVIQHFGVPEEKITLVYPSVNPIFFQESQEKVDDVVLEKYSLTPGYLYHGGGLEIRKNTESLLTAYAAWQKSSGHAREIPPLVISGTLHDPSNRLATNVRELVKKLAIEEYVHLLGFVPEEDLPALYRQASLFVFPSLYEGFGMPIVEALSQGTAVMASRNSSLGEVGGESLFWATAYTKETLQKNYQQALESSQEERAIRVLEAKRFASWRSFTEKVVDILIQ